MCTPLFASLLNIMAKNVVFNTYSPLCVRACVLFNILLQLWFCIGPISVYAGHIHILSDHPQFVTFKSLQNISDFMVFAIYLFCLECLV